MAYPPAWGWSDPEHEVLLRKLYAEGLSATQIAVQLNAAFRDARYSRNAVIGKVTRLALGGRARPSTPKAQTQRRAPRPIVLKLAGNGAVFHGADPRPPHVVVPFRVEPVGLATLDTLGAHECKWPIGDPQLAGFAYCGRGAPDGPYCPEHAAAAHMPEKAKRKSSGGDELARSLRRYL